MTKKQESVSLVSDNIYNVTFTEYTDGSFQVDYDNPAHIGVNTWLFTPKSKSPILKAVKNLIKLIEDSSCDDLA